MSRYNLNHMIQIVDANDQIIGHKERSEVDHDRDIYRISVLWVINSNGQVLLTQRSWNKDKDPGKWGPAVSGTLEEGETYESNIYKEAEEELGITDFNFKLGPKLKVEKPRKYFGQWYLCVIDKETDSFKPQPEEVENVKWISKKELIIDFAQNPENYFSGMSQVIKFFVDPKN